MFEMIGLLIGLTLLCGIALLAGVILAALAWFLFWGRRRPKRLILVTGLFPIFTLAYLVVCAICMEIFVPNQPDFFFGDFNEPLPNGYVLSGLGKMPEYSGIESTSHDRSLPQLLGSVQAIEQDGDLIFGKYSHPNAGPPAFFAPQGINFFALNTHTGQIQNFRTAEELDASAGHQVHLVESQLFRSQEPGRILLRKIENVIFYGPPAVALLFFIFQLLRQRIKLEGATLDRLQN